MKNKILVVMLALGLVCVFSGSAAAGVWGYSLDRAGMKAFTEATPSGAQRRGGGGRCRDCPADRTGPHPRRHRGVSRHPADEHPFPAALIRRPRA